MKQANGNPARAKANPSCKKNKAPIVRDGEAIEDLEHLEDRFAGSVFANAGPIEIDLKS